MKLITLNTWGGRIAEPLLQFIRTSADADVFCFQEMYHGAEGKEKEYDKDYHELFSAIADLLPGHAGHFHPHYGDYYGLALFHSKQLDLLSLEEKFVHRRKEDAALLEGGYHPRNIQVAAFARDGRKFTVINFHGLWNGRGKSDSEDRLRQSEKLAAEIRKIEGEVVLAGDFNLNPDTESLRLIEAAGLRNLIADFGITDTRTSYYEKEGRFADYVLVSPGIRVKNFRVRPEEVSDHAALELEFEI